METPAVYFGKQGKGIWKSKEEFSNPYNWSGYVVGQILTKPEYMGHTVNFRSHKQSYKDKNAVMNPKEDWLIFEDTHEAIVDRETWELAQKLRKTPKRMVAEKKELPIYHVKRHKALTVRIAELIEDLEELRSEKALLLQKFEYAEDAGAEAFRKDIAIMESGLKNLEVQEQKYSAELDKALAEYSDLQAQAAELNPVELYAARQAIRPTQEKAAEQQLEDAMHEKPSLIMLLSARQETSRLLGEDVEERQARQMGMQRQK